MTPKQLLIEHVLKTDDKKRERHRSLFFVFLFVCV